jgi:hypothetical protein
MADDVTIRVGGENDSGAALASAQGGIKDLAAEAERANKQMAAGAGHSRSYADGIDRVGESGGRAETTFLGLGAGISGANTLMSGGGPEDYAMALADLGDATEHTVIPAVKGLVGQLGGLKSAAIATGLAIGAAGLVYALKQYNDAADEARGKDLAEEFERTGKAGETMAAAIAGDDFAMGDMANTFDNLLEKSPELAQAYLDQARASGLNAEAAESAQNAIDDLKSSQDMLADSIRGVTDAQRASMDPVFAIIDANQSLRDATQAVAEADQAVADAAKEHGENSAEYRDAIQGLSDARLDEAKAAVDQEAATRELAAAMIDGGASVEATIAHLQGLANQGKISQATVDAVSRSLRNVPDETSTVLKAHDQASHIIDAAGDKARRLDGDIVDILLQASWIGGGSAYAAFTGRTRRAGGIQGAATGGARNGLTLVGEAGPELVNLAPGSMVHTAGDTQRMLSSGGGDVHVHLNVGGSFYGDERALVRVMRDEFQRGGFANLVGAR